MTALNPEITPACVPPKGSALTRLTLATAHGCSIGLALSLVLPACGEDGKAVDQSGDGDDPTDAISQLSGSGDDEGDDGDDSADSLGSKRWDMGTDDDPSVDTPKEVEFSYIWIANSKEGTVSKINTRTMEEEARYKTGPGLDPNPSRTSVNLVADVAVVNRSGSVIKINVRTEECKDKNGNGTIETSKSGTDILAWGEDECVAWHTQLENASRPAAWTSGTEVMNPDGETKFVDPRLWVSAPVPKKSTSEEGTDVVVYKLDDVDGKILEQVTIKNIVSEAFMQSFGLYGAAVDSKNNFWANTLTVASARNGAKLVKVSNEDINDVELIDVPITQGYGITVDQEDRIWLGCTYEVDFEGKTIDGGVLQFYDSEAETWGQVDLSDFKDYKKWWIRGMMVDAVGELWAAVVAGTNETMPGNGSGILRVDTHTGEAIEFIGPEHLEGVKVPTGVSIDVDGYVWLVDQHAGPGGAAEKGRAYRMSPEDDHLYEVIDSLNLPYTYSDMTGFALQNVQVDPPERRRP